MKEIKLLRVKNTHNTNIGFGTLSLFPEKTETLPEGYNKDHPVVAFYIKKGWITVVGENKKKSPVDDKPKDPPAPVTPIEPPVPPVDDKDENTNGETDEELETKVAALKTMNGNALRKICDELKIAYEKDDTVDTLRAAIEDSYRTGEDSE
ncbi:MAG: DUF5102 domain-containing protein [Oscillospiraceae bacterium]|nr:DUF5102 domain-containing protein [Oscillospiraceae bacterium]